MNTENRVRRLLRTVALPVLLAAGALLLLGSPASAHGDGHHEVEIKQYMYMPMALSIEQGESVTWTNSDTVGHDVTVTAGPVSFHSPMLAQGKSWTYTFATAGRYSYICSVHPDMKATITVSAAAPVSRPSAPATSKAAVVAKAQPSSKPTSPAGHPAAAHPAQAQPVTSVTQGVAAAKPGLVEAPASSATLQPLILVVGAAVGVVLFCLLLMASRPIQVDDPAVLRLEPKHLEEG
ncbi:MAG: cupredoxin domain-containing protein [Marmoricola sp.]